MEFDIFGIAVKMASAEIYGINYDDLAHYATDMARWILDHKDMVERLEEVEGYLTGYKNMNKITLDAIAINNSNKDVLKSLLTLSGVDRDRYKRKAEGMWSLLESIKNSIEKFSEYNHCHEEFDK